MGLVRFLIITILSLYIIRSIIRLLLPMLFQSVINKAQQQQNYQQNTTQQKKPEGGIKVDYIPEGKKGKVPDNAGDFIDYEEIK